MANVIIKDWFVNKIDLGYGKKLYDNMGIVKKETEKAYLLEVEWFSLDGEYEGVKDVWVPKSCTMSLEEYAEASKAAEERFNAGCDRYNKLVEFAKANGVKGVRVGLKAKTIEKKIAEAGLVFAF